MTDRAKQGINEFMEMCRGSYKLEQAKKTLDSACGAKDRDQLRTNTAWITISKSYSRFHSERAVPLTSEGSWRG